MTVRSDLAAVLVSHGQTWDQARETLDLILSAARYPDFAIAYAKRQDEPEAASEHMSDYWRVIDFLAWTVKGDDPVERSGY